jgi:hypothetical protein
MPCTRGVCPSASVDFTPADSGSGPTTHFQFKERHDGTVQGILNITDPLNGIAVHGCNTASSACRLTVDKFTCSGGHGATIEGTYKLRNAPPVSYQLILSGNPHVPGDFILSIYSDTTDVLTGNGNVDVTCPPAAAP